MTYADDSYDPEAVSLLQGALDAAWTRALREVPTLQLLGRDGGMMRRAMARAIFTAAGQGLRDPAELAERALVVVPTLRRPASAG